MLENNFTLLAMEQSEREKIMKEFRASNRFVAFDNQLRPS